VLLLVPLLLVPLLLVLLVPQVLLLVPLQELQFFLRSQQMRLSLQEREIQKTFSLLCLFLLFNN